MEISEEAVSLKKAGAKRVVITAPLKEKGGTGEMGEMGERGGRGERGEMGKAETVLVGINEEKLQTCKISSNASCTTNAASPIIAIFDEALGIEKAILNTVHAYTATQSLVDSPAGRRGMREGRAAAHNIIPSSTGAAIAVTRAYPKLEGKFDGISLRVPVVCGSIADITFIAKRDTSAEEINQLFKNVAAHHLKGIIEYTEDPLVSCDIIGNPHSTVFDADLTKVMDGRFVKIGAWYDNEWGYSCRVVDLMKLL